jgi:hypothetical protein
MFQVKVTAINEVNRLGTFLLSGFHCWSLVCDFSFLQYAV